MTSTELHDQLWDNAKYLKDSLEKLGFNTGESKHQLHQLLLVMKKKTQEFSKRLKDEGVYENLSYSQQYLVVQVV